MIRHQFIPGLRVLTASRDVAQALRQRHMPDAAKAANEAIEAGIELAEEAIAAARLLPRSALEEFKSSIRARLGIL